MRPRSVDFSQFNSSLAVTFWRFCSIEIRPANRTEDGEKFLLIWEWWMRRETSLSVSIWV